MGGVGQIPVSVTGVDTGFHCAHTHILTNQRTVLYTQEYFGFHLQSHWFTSILSIPENRHKLRNNVLVCIEGNVYMFLCWSFTISLSTSQLMHGLYWTVTWIFVLIHVFMPFPFVCLCLFVNRIIQTRLDQCSWAVAEGCVMGQERSCYILIWKKTTGMFRELIWNVCNAVQLYWL